MNLNSTLLGQRRPLPNPAFAMKGQILYSHPTCMQFQASRGLAICITNCNQPVPCACRGVHVLHFEGVETIEERQRFSMEKATNACDTWLRHKLCLFALLTGPCRVNELGVLDAEGEDTEPESSERLSRRKDWRAKTSSKSSGRSSITALVPEGTETV